MTAEIKSITVHMKQKNQITVKCKPATIKKKHYCVFSLSLSWTFCGLSNWIRRRMFLLSITPWMNSPSVILPDDDTEKMHSSKLNKAYSVKGDVSLSHIYNATHTKTRLPFSFFPKKSQILSVRFSGVFSSSGRFFWSSLEIMLNIDCKEEQRDCTYSDESALQ